MSTAASSVRATGPAAGRVRNGYGVLLERVRGAGLLRRSYGFYLFLTGALTLGLGATIVGMLTLGDSGWQVLVAVAVGLLLTQFAFLGHEASHRQVFRSKKANDVFGGIVATCVVGISYSWWMNKHTRHHANPNRIGHDPDIDADTIVFQPEQAGGKGRLYSWFLRHQGTLFFPLLLLEGINLQFQGMRYLVTAGRTIRGRGVELVLLSLRLVAMPVLAFVSMSPLLAVVSILLQLGVFGVYMGASFAPNHKGMPQVPAEAKLSFLHKQVLTSRNISGKGMTAVYGGLNYQIEHHLFPNMARPFLRRAAVLVKEFCREAKIPYVSMSARESYRIVIQYLNAVAKPDRDLFHCPLVTTYGRL